MFHTKTDDKPSSAVNPNSVHCLAQVKKARVGTKIVWERETAYGAYSRHLLMHKEHQKKVEFYGLAVMRIELLLQTWLSVTCNSRLIWNHDHNMHPLNMSFVYWIEEGALLRTNAGFPIITILETIISVLRIAQPHDFESGENMQFAVSLLPSNDPR